MIDFRNVHPNKRLTYIAQTLTPTIRGVSKIMSRTAISTLTPKMSIDR